MNTDIIAGKWKQAISNIKSEWADLTDDDLKKVEASRDHLVGVIQERYGKSKEQADEQVQAFWKKHDSDHKI
jgi:uncharacterized protein YjbJ (UPF0337 family)